MQTPSTHLSIHPSTPPSYRKHLTSALAALILVNSSGAIAQSNQPNHNFCRREQSMFLAIETKNFLVNICGGDLPNTYVGVDRKTRKSIRLPLKDYDDRGQYFEAVNGDYTYILANTPRGKFLTVSKGTRELLREPVLRGW